MDLFKNEVNNIKFKSTNSIWNELHLNSPWLIGYVSEIIKQKKFKSKEEWKEFYFNSGQERKKIINSLHKSEQDILNGKYLKSSFEKKHINLYMGRTKIEIGKLGSELYRKLEENGNELNITERECQFIAYFRVVCETWNGVVFREAKTKATILEHFRKANKQILLIDTFGDFDTKYAVDFELYHDGKIVCGLQIKPNSYKHCKNIHVEAFNLNKKKNEDYTNKYNRPVFYIYSNTDGYISNLDVLKEILKII